MNERLGRYTSKQTYREALGSFRVLQDGPVHSAEAVLDRQIQPVSPLLAPILHPGDGDTLSPVSFCL